MDDVPYGLVVFMIVGALVVVAINDWQKRRLSERAWEKGEKPKREYLNHRTDWWLVAIMAITVVGGATIGTQWKTLFPELQETLRQWGPGLMIAGEALLWVGRALLVIVVLLVVLIFIQRRLSSPIRQEFAQIQKWGLEGNIATAIQMVQRILDRPAHRAGTAVHQVGLYHLAVLEGMRGDCQRTLQLIQRLEQYFDQSPTVVATKSLAYWQLGRQEEAEQGLRERVRINPDNTAALAALGLFLVDTNRITEACKLLQDLDRRMAETTARPIEIDVTEDLRRATNASNKLGPELTHAEFDMAMRRLLVLSMEGITFRDQNGSLPDSTQDPAVETPA